MKLLEDHLKKLREEDGIEVDEEEDDVAAWEGWDVESDSSEESEDGWIPVEPDGEDLDISDSEDEDDKRKKAKGKNGDNDGEDEDEKPAEAEPARVSMMATTKVRLSNIHLQLLLD